MTKQSARSGRVSRPPTPVEADGDAAGPTLSKTVMFQGHEDLYEKILEVQARNKGSFSRAVLSVLEAGLAAAPVSGPDLVVVGALPPWLRSLITEAARLTGHTPAGVVVDVLAKHTRDYVEYARSLESGAAGLLSNQKPQSPAPNSR